MVETKLSNKLGASPYLTQSSNEKVNPANELVETKETNNSGQITLESFAGLTMDDTLIFQYTTSSGWGSSNTYSNSATVSELINGSGNLMLE